MLKKTKQFIEKQFEFQTVRLEEQSVLNTNRIINELKTLSNDIVGAIGSISQKGIETRLEANTATLKSILNTYEGITQEISALAENIRDKELKMQLPANWKESPWAQLEELTIIEKENQRLLEIISSQY